MKVYAAIAAVMGDLARTGVAKTQTNTFDKYKFRGIDDVYNALAPLLAKHGLVILPRVLSRESQERKSNDGKAIFYIVVDAEFDFVAAEDGSKHTVRAFGEAMDRGDKGTNKAMTAAYKYAMFEAFCIPTEGADDADRESHEVKHSPAVSTINAKPKDGCWDGIDAARKQAIEDMAEIVKEYAAEQDYAGANEYLHRQTLEANEKIAIWTLLDSKTRAALKKATTIAA